MRKVKFAVLAIPHAVAVDGRGTIVACGRSRKSWRRQAD